ncbi:MAG TPA: DksA/TraR family C4-type zinc finger protein, partial [Rhodobacterales bacterium]|nr:DksA/TraR family C4-type zinc finger protein [Rhodobacterales bacterium]
MAGGWSRDGAVNAQIEASIAEELERMRARGLHPSGESAIDCADCGEPIPEARRKA